MRPRSAGYAMACALLSELNTIFLLLRRALIPLQFRGKSLVYLANSTLFYTTWALIRLCLHPFLTLVVYPQDYLAAREETGSAFNLVLPQYLVALLLFVLNLQWTATLVFTNYRRVVKSLKLSAKQP